MRTLFSKCEIWQVRSGEKSVLQAHVLLWKEEGSDDLFESRVPAEEYEEGCSLEDLQGTLIPAEYYRVPYKPGWTVFEGPLKDTHFLKESAIRDYLPDENEEDWPSRETSDEIDIYEKLKHHPHPNIVKYHGVQVKNGYVVGIVIDKLDAEMYDALGSPCKASHILDIEVTIKDLKAAVDHLHSIGIVHCDIAPSNLGIDSNGRVLLFDFDCAFPIGTLFYGKISNGCWKLQPDILLAEFACVEIDYECLRLTKEGLLAYPQKFEVVTTSEDDAHPEHV